MAKGKRAGDQTQISITIPKALLADIDRLAIDDNRNRSNWIVTELQRAVALKDGLSEKKAAPHASSADPRVSEKPARRRGSHAVASGSADAPQSSSTRGLGPENLAALRLGAELGEAQRPAQGKLA